MLASRLRLATRLTLLGCCRAAAGRAPHALAASRAFSTALSHHRPGSALLRLRGGAADTIPAANLTTDATAGKPVVIDTAAEFADALDEAGDKLVVVDFTATWCGPCKVIAPHFEAIAAEYAGKAVCLKVDVDANGETAAECGIRAMPTFQFYKNGAKVAEFAGADKDKLRSTVEELVE